jgi:hypothetical protein
MSGQLCRTCSDWPCICGESPSHALLPKLPTKPKPLLGNCERCDRWGVEEFQGHRICFMCREAMRPDPMTAYKQMVEREGEI